MNILGIESSCDDSCAAVIDSDYRVLSNIVISPNKMYLKYDGVVPEVVARSHLDTLGIAIELALKCSDMHFNDLNLIAFTGGPGLIGSVILSVIFGKTLSNILSIPCIGINHLEGHVLIPQMFDSITFPYILFLTSGGHCQLIIVNNIGCYNVMGQTLDDSLGEVFDKVAVMMGLNFPGGPNIEKYAYYGDSKRFIFPKPMCNMRTLNMSFSGLKTAVKIQIKKLGLLSFQDICDLSASFQHTVMEILFNKLRLLIFYYEQKYYYNKYFVLSGGVAANFFLQFCLRHIILNYGYKFFVPPMNICTDNAVMIAFVGLKKFSIGYCSGINFIPRNSWTLSSL